jgi:uncharacterized protein (DUF362 family)
LGTAGVLKRGFKQMKKDKALECGGQSEEGVDRRAFIAGTASALAATGLMVEADEAMAEGRQDKTRRAPLVRPVKEGSGHIVQVSHSGATEKIKKTNEDIVRAMVEKALTTYTGQKDIASALGKYFKKEDVVGIKINALGCPYAAVHPATAFALADGLHALGIPKNNIYIYDQYGSRMRKAGFKVMRPKQKPKEDQYQVHNHETLGYERAPTDVGGFNKHNKKPYKSKLPKLVDRLTAVLNVCCVKDHDLTGITGALKNVSYGNVDRVPIYHCKPECNPSCVHDGKCNVSRIYTHEKMGGLVRLVVCDALRVLYQGGPQDNMTYKAAHNAVLVSTDPVAIDRAIVEIVNSYRKERKLKPIEEDQGGRRNPLRFIAAANALGLGENDLAKIKWDKVEMG